MRCLYGRLISNGGTCVKCLQERNLLPELDSCSKIKDCVIRRSTLKECQKSKCKKDSNGNLLKTTYLRCQKKVAKLITL